MTEQRAAINGQGVADREGPERISTPPLLWERAEHRETIPSSACTSPLTVEYIAAHPLDDRGELRLCRAPISGCGKSWMVVHRGAGGVWEVRVPPSWWAPEAGWRAAMQVLGQIHAEAYTGADTVAQARASRMLAALGNRWSLDRHGDAERAAGVVAERMAPDGSPFVSAYELGVGTRAESSLAVPAGVERGRLRAVLASAFLAGVEFQSRADAVSRPAAG